MPKKILIDVLHPCHVHLFKHFYKIMKEKGHEIKVTARKKEVALELLDIYKIPYTQISSIGNKKFKLIIEMLLRTWKLFWIVKKFKPDVLLGIMGPSIAIVGKLLKIPCYVIYDVECAKLTNSFVIPWCTKFITPNGYRDDLGNKQIKFEGTQELFYLRPEYFKPDESILDIVGVKKNETFTIVRFVSWGASHDIGHSGISNENKNKAIKEFEKFSKVFISSENELPDELKKYQVNIPIEKMHDLISFATLVYGESATFASEAASLGTYSIYLDNDGRGSIDRLETKYHLVNNFTESLDDQEKSIQKGIEILKNLNAKKEAQEKTKYLMDNTIDCTKFLMEMIENG